ncbi:MAG: Gfo/Idh/MocA family protein, partial [Planctomycetota bacterium]
AAATRETRGAWGSIQETTMSAAVTRRDFFKASAVVAGGVGIAAYARRAEAATNMCGYAAEPIEKVRVGVIGLGMRGPGAVSRLSKIDDVEIVALADLRESCVAKGQRILAKSGRPAAKGFSGSEDAWRGVCDMDLDLVYIATPWRWHTPMAVRAMKHGKHAATEVPATVKLEESWELVETSESTRRHFMQLENCCYDFFELTTLNMVRQGALGELVHAEAAYIHDLRGLNFSKGGYQGMWRLIQNRDRNGNLYPTHGLGPVAQCMNINRGDRFEYLTALSSGDFMMGPRSRALAAKDPFYRPYVSDGYRGQMNTTVIRTAKGRSIMVQHDVTSPRPYSRIHLLSGTKGIAQKWPDQRIALGHRWLDGKKMRETCDKYAHPLSRTIGATARKVGGHGGMDFIMDYRLIYSLKNGLPLDQDVYDAAAWSDVGPLSEKSVTNRSSSVEVPDFTRGAWKKNKPLGIIDVDVERLPLRAKRAARPIDHAILGKWEYRHGGKTYTREFTKDGVCVLKAGDKQVWRMDFYVRNKKTVIVGGGYEHILKDDGSLDIEGSYTATRR